VRYTSRPYAGEPDYALLRALLVEIERAEGSLVYCFLGDLDWWRFTEEQPDEAITATRLWFADEALVGFAWPRNDQVDLITHPAHRSAETEMLTWAEERLRAATTPGETARLTAWSFEHHHERVALLRARGYERGAMHFNINARRLDEAPPAAPLPPGYRIRHVRGVEDVPARVEVHRSAFAPSRMTTAKHLAVMAAPTYRPELDLVVEAPDGSFAAYCLVWFNQANRTGEFEPVGCHADHRRKGLTTAVLFEGMRRLHALGATSCAVVSSGEEKYAASRQLYSSVGFAVEGRIYAWERELR
jgi:mycothiol synthase